MPRTALVGVLVAVLSSVYPAVIAARLPPAEAVARPEEGSEDNQDHPSTTEEENSGDEEG